MMGIRKDTMRCYVGRREPIGAFVYVDEKGALYPLKHVERHSQTGCDWGYEGNGPADLALSILTDATWGDQEACEALYQDFKREVISNLPQDGWRLREDFVRAWLRAKRLPAGRARR